jgi:MFS transporter, DHA2 family, multidrug resistance protein
LAKVQLGFGSRQQFDGVQIYMTFRQLGASLGVAFLTILLERRETLHSSRPYEHLNAANETTSTSLSSMSNFLYTNSGASTSRTSLMFVGLLARTGAQQVAALSYADCFLFMAMIGVIAFCFIPLLAPFVAAPKQAEQLLPSRIEKETPRT